MPEPDLTRSVVGASFISPVINGIMHIPPAVAASRIALGYDQQLDIPILLLLFALHVLIDGKSSPPTPPVEPHTLQLKLTFPAVLDKYVDLPPESRKLWSRSIGVFASLLLGLAAYGTWSCGIKALARLLVVPALAIVHAMPLIPWYSRSKRGFSLVKLKYVLGPFKSIFGGTCIGLMDTTTIVLYLCDAHNCREEAFEAKQLQVLAYTILYDFLWESIADVRDREEDLHNGDTTLATAFGVRPTLMLVAVSTIFGDVCITSFDGRGFVSGTSIARAITFWAAFSLLAINKPRRAVISWSAGTLVGLLPVWVASVGMSGRSIGQD